MGDGEMGLCYCGGVMERRIQRFTNMWIGGQWKLAHVVNSGLEDRFGA